MKSNKIYIVAAISFAVGLAVFFAGFAGLSFNFKNFYSEKDSVKKTYVSKSEITDFNLEDRNVAVKLITSEDGNFHIDYRESKSYTYDITENGNGALDIVKVFSNNWFENILNFGFYDNVITVEVPQKYSGNLTAKTSNASVTATGITADDLTLISSNAKIDAEDIALKGNLGCDTSNSKISLDRVTALGNVDCNTSNSATELENVTAKRVQAETSNSGITAEKVMSQSDIYLKTSNGRLEIEDPTFVTELNCKTSNGSITGTLTGALGDYSYNCKTSNGDCNLPESISGPDKTVTLKTSNGKINVDFHKD